MLSLITTSDGVFVSLFNCFIYEVTEKDLAGIYSLFGGIVKIFQIISDKIIIIRFYILPTRITNR